MKTVLAVFFALAALAVSTMSAYAEELTVSAAVSLTEPFNRIKASFEAENPGARVTYNFGASGALLQQIRNGAPVDVFASADEDTMLSAVKAGLVDKKTEKDFARNTLVLVVPAGSKSGIKGMKDLTADTTKKVAVGNPETVPAGKYAKKALEGERLWDVLSPKFVYAENVRQVLDYVGRGEVDAGFVYKTDAAVSARVMVVGEVRGTGPIIYPIAVVKDSKHRALALKFVNFVTGPKGKGVLKSCGFLVK